MQLTNNNKYLLLLDRSEVAVVGIDVGGLKKGVHAVALSKKL
jgi:hypothetical protein